MPKKNGIVKGSQRYKCLKCGYQYTRDTLRGKRPEDKRFAIFLYAAGLSRRLISRVIGVSVTTVSRWVDLYYTDEIKKRRPEMILRKIKPEDVVQKLIIKGFPEHEHKSASYVLSTETTTKYKISFIIELP